MTEKTIPHTWSMASLCDLGEWRGGGTPSKLVEDYWNGNIPWVSPKDMKQDSIFDSADHITQNAVDDSATKLIPPDSILCVTRSGILAHTFPVAITMVPVTVNQDIKALTPSRGIHPRYLAWALRAEGREILETCSKDGTTVNSIESSRLYAHRVPVAPQKEQLRIVAKIEELFSELDNGIESLKSVQGQLQTYRQALLKSAFEGELTVRWRAKNKKGLETGEQFVLRSEKTGEDFIRARSKKLESITDKELQDFPSLPAGWTYSRLGVFIEDIQAGKSFKCDEREPRDNEVGVAKVSAVTWGEYDDKESKTCIDLEKINPNLYIREGDFLFSRANTIELVGACVIVRATSKNIMLSDKTLRILFHSGDKGYFLQYLRSHSGRNEIMKRSTGNQESMRNIGQDRIRSVIVPVCSEAEMTEITKTLSEHFTRIDALESAIQDELVRSEALRQSILRNAFSGKLVMQDPNDEPASILLERIRSEKTEKTNGKKITRRKDAA